MLDCSKRCHLGNFIHPLLEDSEGSDNARKLNTAGATVDIKDLQCRGIPSVISVRLFRAPFYNTHEGLNRLPKTT